LARGKRRGKILRRKAGKNRRWSEGERTLLLETASVLTLKSLLARRNGADFYTEKRRCLSGRFFPRGEGSAGKGMKKGFVREGLIFSKKEKRSRQS